MEPRDRPAHGQVRRPEEASLPVSGLPLLRLPVHLSGRAVDLAAWSRNVHFGRCWRPTG